MNLLSLSQELVVECGVSGTLTTVAGQSGEMARTIAWIGKAWEEVQLAHDDWFFMRSSNILNPGTTGMQFTSVSGTASYPLGTGAGTCGIPSANFGKWARGTFRNYPTAVGVAGEIEMTDEFFDVWRDTYMLGANRSVKTQPVIVAIGPDESICLGPPPAAGYTFTGDYFTAPTVMAVDADTPTGLPVQFHRIILWKAMMLYAGYESAPEVFQKAAPLYESAMSRLERIKLPTATPGGALA